MMKKMFCWENTKTIKVSELRTEIKTKCIDNATNLYKIYYYTIV